jgi:peptide/nickel transport system ATP-binding protein
MANPEEHRVLRVKNLTVGYGTRGRKTQGHRFTVAVDHVTFDLRRGESLAIVGESGSGKSTLAYALVNLLPAEGHVLEGVISLEGSPNLVREPERNWVAVRGARIAMVFQGAQNMFNPVATFREQFRDIFEAHNVPLSLGFETARELLRATRLDPDRVLSAYPHELSGGTRQRMAIVSCLMLRPQVVILDEPTTALDSVTQAQVLTAVARLRRKYATSLVFITHDFAVAATMGDRVAVMYAGEFVEIGDTDRVLREARHPYTRGLIGAVPSLTQMAGPLNAIPGQPPDLRDPPKGCRFAPRCRYQTPACLETHPSLMPVDDSGHFSRCIRWCTLPQEGEQ